MNRYIRPLILLLVGVIFVAVLSGCEKKTLNEDANQIIAPMAESIGGSSFSVTEPGTLIMSFTNRWSELSEEEQRTFMNDTGKTWTALARGHGADLAEIQVQFEDHMGNVVRTYTPDKGIQ